ncbi:hypothetical protein GK108_28075 [Spirosoma terrae]|uniref:D-alanine--D-alanine ligase n=1 Tax=Spirosoma terrae TaxID=1968276 RepID=A0A6L9LE02_9BACT|nr:hypothetical protein [Spirosoma terrae]
MLTERPIQPSQNPLPSVAGSTSKMAHIRQWLSRFRIRLFNWEYWPFTVVYIPVFVYYLYLAAKARSLFFFSASNPAIESGGLLGESKIDILDLISDQFKPKTLFFRQFVSINQILNRMVLAGFWFPIIAKPNQGERGWRVEKLHNEDELTEYLLTNHMDLIVQEYVDESIELGVFYYRMPGEKTGTISSIVQKEFLSITGDGQSTMLQLISQSDRAMLQLSALIERYGDHLNDVLDRKQVVQLMPIGNHCRGTKFLNANHLITPELVAVFDQISLSIDGFYYGRYDLRCRSIEDLYQGKHISILELNGAGAEPAHIYHPGFSLWQGWRILLQHWHILYTISRENHRRGVPYMTRQEALTIYRRIQTYSKPTPTL